MKKFLFVTVLVCFPIFGMLACNSLNNSPASPFSATSPNNGGTSPSTPGSPQNTPTFTNTLQPGVPTYTFTYTPTKTQTPVPGGPTNTFTFTPTKTATLYPPSISSVSSVTYSYPFILTIYGSNFVSGANFNASYASSNPYGATTYINSSELQADIYPSVYASSGTIYVTNPSGQSSNTITFYVTPAAPTPTYTSTPIPIPSISSVSPSPMPGSTSAQQFTVNGTNYNSNCILVFEDTLGNLYYSNLHPYDVISITSTQFVYDMDNNNDAGTWHVMVDNQTTGEVSSWYPFTVL